MHLVTTEEMRRIEAAADAAGLSYAQMMQRAGQALVKALDERLGPSSVLVLAGPGNNGGDGLVAAAALAEAAWDVRVYAWRRPVDEGLLGQALADSEVPVCRVEDDPDLRTLDAWLADSAVVIDALLGTGLKRPLAGDVARILTVLHRAQERADPPFVAAADLPSGLDADSGALDPHTVPAHLTVTFGFPKLGQVRFPGAHAVGELVVDGIGIPAELAGGSLYLAQAPELAALLPPRPADGHKGSFGRVLVAGGSTRYTGAAYLAAAAAYRAGCGLVTAAIPAPIQPALAGLIPEATFLPLADEAGVLAPGAAAELAALWADFEVLLLGPGLSTQAAAAGFLAALLDHLAAAVHGSPRHLVVDADGLNLLATLAEGPRRLPPGSVLTPHPGEMARLLGSSAAAVNAEREAVARDAALAWGHVVVLKGPFSVVAAPDGRVSVNPCATSALAKAGTGDVLAGLIAGLLAQGLGPFEAAVAGTWLHGRAGLAAARQHGERSVLASEVLGLIGYALRELEEAGRQ